MVSNKLTFISNNVRGLLNKNKRLKTINYLKSKLTDGIIFLQETHSSVNNEIQWKNKLNTQSFFSHGKSNPCGVLTAYYGSKNFILRNQLCDKEGRILILDVRIDDSNYILINFYNANTELDQLAVISSLNTMLQKIDSTQTHNIIFAGDFNLYFDKKLETKGCKPNLKLKSIAEIIKIQEQYSFCDIWRIRNPFKKRFTFRQNHFPGFFQLRLDYIFISSNMQEFSDHVDILPGLSTDHSAVVVTLMDENEFERGPGLWKFNSSLLCDQIFTSSLKIHIEEIKNEFNSDCDIDDQIKWELIKYKIRNFSLKFSKKRALERKI